jgi:hypothetical protein
MLMPSACDVLQIDGHLVQSRFGLEFRCFYLIVDIAPVNIVIVYEKGNKITQLRFKGRSDVLCKTSVQTWQDKL